MIALTSNEYWGRKSGTNHPTMGCIFKLKKWGNGANNSHKSGWKLKTHERRYRNQKLNRLARRIH